MRLPWPFGRRSPSEGPSSAATEAGAAGVRPVDSGPSTSTPTRAWAALPPIQRTVGAAPLVAPSAPFLDDVPGHRPMPPMLQPLGHDAGPSGPPGLVVAHSYPVPSLTSGTPMPPVQHRATARRGQAADATAAWPEPASVPGAGSTASPPEADPVPVRHVAAVSPSAVATPPARPLTRATTLAPAGRPVVSRSAAGPTPSSAAAAASPALSTPADARWGEASSSTGTSGTAAAGPGLPLGPRRGASEPWNARDRAGVADAGSLPARRPGLGAPIAAPPTPEVAQRLPMRTPVRPHTSAAAADEARAAARAQSTGAAGPEAPGPRPRASSLPILPVARRHADRASEPAQGSTPASAPSPSRAASSPASAPSAVNPSAGVGGADAAKRMTTRPTMGFRPLRPSIPAQRTADGGSTASTDNPSVSGDARAAPVAARWGLGDTLPATVVSRSVGDTHVGQPGVQLTALGATAPGSGASGPGAPDLAAFPSEIVFPPRDAAADIHPSSPDAGPPAAAPVQWSSVRPPAISSPASGSNLPPRPASRAGAPVPVRPLTLARSVAATQAAASSHASGSSGAPVVARIVADPSTPGGAPTVQASAAGGAGVTPVAAITATPIVQRVEGAAPPVESGPQGHSDNELDDLARALFGRIRTHLRAEVIHEREAKGLTFDAF